MIHFILADVAGTFDKGEFTMEGSGLTVSRLEMGLAQQLEALMRESPHRVLGETALAASMLVRMGATILEKTETPDVPGVVY